MKSLILFAFLAIIVATVYGRTVDLDDEEIDMVIQKRFFGKLKEAWNKLKGWVAGGIDKLLGNGTFNRLVSQVAGKLTSGSTRDFCTRIANSIVDKASRGKVNAGEYTPGICDKALEIAAKQVNKLRR